MTKVAILNDTHAGARNSSGIFIEYQRRFYTEVFFPYLRENGIDRILHLGDYYEHRKFVNFKVLNANRTHFLEKLREFNITMDIIPGNHDVTYRNTNDLCSLNELMIGYEDVVNIHMKPTELKFADNDKKVIMLPWINSENEHYTLKCIEQTDASICLGHFEFQGFEMYRGAICHEGMDMKPFDKFDDVYSGHYHTKSSNGHIHYLGSQMEFNWSDVDDPKFFHILDLETGELEGVQNHITLFTKVVYNDELFDYNNFDYSIFNEQFVKVVVENKSNYRDFETFISNIQLKKVYDLKIVESFDGLSSYDDDDEENTQFEETSELIAQYIDGVDTLLDRELLKSQINELYHEALNAEQL